MGVKKNARRSTVAQFGPDASRPRLAHQEAPGKRQKDAKTSHERLLTLVIIGIALIRLGFRWYTKPQTMISCTPEQELVQVFTDFLPRHEFEALKSCTLGHSKLHVQSALGDKAFGKTKGFVVKFNNDGVSTFLNHPDYGECFGSLFERMRLPETNAYVFNALLCELSDYESWKSNKTSVGLHLDQTVGMRQHVHSISDFLAHQVNVLYIDIADDMVGGSWSITPEINTMVAFRGDGFHQVKAYHNAHGSKKKRLSLVLEQYKIDTQYYANTIEWAEEQKASYTD
eukprot:jgi/Picre1/29165/NNA_004558.t1